LGGSVMEFFQLVENLRSRRAIYGMQRRGVDGVEKPLERIEDLAQYYLDGIQNLQPHGPYLLVGYSLGGLITLEIAQQMLARGETVSLLVMIETYPHWKYLSISQNGRIARSMVKPGIGKILRSAGIRTELGEEWGRMGDGPQVGESFAHVAGRVRRADSLMWQRYRPRYYKGKVNFIRRTEGSAKFPIDPRAVWGRLVDELIIDTVPGDHVGVIATNSKSTAAVLSCYLEQVLTSE
jgi:thioesterase domain-containing protein